MRLRDVLVISVCAALLAFLGLACCCPMAFPTGDYWPDTAGSKRNGIAVPKLEVTYPTEGSYTESSQLDVSGFTDSDATVTVNGKEMDVFSDGSFKGLVDLTSGENTLIITASRPGGDPAVQEITVTSSAST